MRQERIDLHNWWQSSRSGRAEDSEIQVALETRVRAREMESGELRSATIQAFLRMRAAAADHPFVFTRIAHFQALFGVLEERGVENIRDIERAIYGREEAS